jgi:lysine-N-methylase
MPASAPIHLPIFQRFDCQSCTYCCRNLVVNVGEADRKRIMAAGWEKKMGDVPMFVEYRFGGRTLFRLNRRSDGACVFLGADNLCRLHAETGPATKPLACRAYPFTVTPGAQDVRVDLRMDCPSVAANKGRTLSVHINEISRLAREAKITEGFQTAPEWGNANRKLSAEEFLAVVGAFETILHAPEPLRLRLRAACELLDLLYAIQVNNVRELRFVELMDLIAGAALEEARNPEKVPVLKSRPARLFRQWLFLHSVADDPEALARGRIARLRSSWHRYRYARRFARARGSVPKMRPDWPETTFEAVEAVQPGPEEAWEPLDRSIRLKLDAHAFAGPGYLAYDVLRGLTALMMMPAVVAWMARLAAVQQGRSTIALDDVIAGVRQTHYTFGVSPVFVSISEQLRLRALAHPGIPAGILTAYGP